jgi:GNAT superfamily N-acetyltransferase
MSRSNRFSDRERRFISASDYAPRPQNSAAMLDVRKMRAADLEKVAELADNAFIEVIAQLSGRRLERPFFPPAGLALRLEADPAGCLVATHGGALVGALFSVARGTLAWFGPLAVSTGQQGKGVGQALVAECVARWAPRGVRLMGLETFANSAFHLHLYSKLGFRPAWVGFQARKLLDAEAGGPAAEPAPPLQHPQLPLPDLGYLYRGFDPAAEVRAVLNRKAGRVFATDRSLAIVLLADAFHVTADDAFIPLLVAPDRDAFLSLVAACEEAARGAGKKAIALRLPGSSWGAFQALVERGYHAGSAMLRMKAGENVDYDRDAWYCDDWL